jgi:membrane-associated protease RseP (regulator of RpoE activity)
MKRIALTAGLLVLTLALPLRAEDRPAAEATSVPFDLFTTKHISIMVKVNGKGPYRVIFDTGSPVILLSNKVARAAGLLNKNSPQPLINLFGSGGQVKVKTLEVGDVAVKDLPAVVMDHPGVQAMANRFGPVEGIVGFPFFSRFRMTLDYQTRTMTLVRNDYVPSDAMENVMATMMNLGAPESPKVVAAAGQWGLVVAKESGDKADGVTVKTVMPDSAAARAGLRAGDRLLTLDGRWTDSVEDTYLAAGFAKAGTPAKVSIERDGKKLELTVTPRAGL